MNYDELYIDDATLTRFLAGETTAEEQQKIISWLDLSEENRERLDQLEVVWLEAGNLQPRPVAVSPELVWGKMEQRVDAYEQSQKTKKHRIIWLTSVAASILVILFVSRIWTSTTTPLTLANLTQVALTDTLPDGSIVALNANSSLEYNKQFGKNNRDLKLNGEAFFQVKRNAQLPFIVDAGIGGVKVLGTQFNVKIEENSDVAIDVVKGKVQVFCFNIVSNDTITTILTRNQSALIQQSSRTILPKKQLPTAIKWYNNTIVFNDTPLQYVFKTLNEHFNIEITCNDNNINALPLNTIFQTDNIDEIIDVITSTFDLEYTKEGNKYTITTP
jgi:ferric-dicitrate binding protein FerR (iron transport regulator)